MIAVHSNLKEIKPRSNTVNHNAVIVDHIAIQVYHPANTYALLFFLVAASDTWRKHESYNSARDDCMLINRFDEAQPYIAPNHRDVVGLRLQGFMEGGPTNQWVGLSQFLPGGGAGPDSTPFEKVYVVIEGEMTVIIDGKETVLKKFDSCTIPANEVREIENRRNDICTMMVIMPYPPESK